MHLTGRSLAQTLALVLFGLLATACSMSIQEIVGLRQGSSESENVLVSGPRAQFIYSHADW